MFEARGKCGIKLLVIDTDGEYWDHSESRLWNFGATMRRLGMAAPKYTDSEFLVENSIPPDHIRHFDWDKVKQRVDPEGRKRQHWRTQFEGQEEERRQRKRRREEEDQGDRPAKERKLTKWNKNFDVKIQERM
jgi:hypothetical protein